MFQDALARDHLWIRKDEAAALARGELPESVMRRIARFHLIDNTRGEPPMWAAKEIRKLEMSLSGGKLVARVHLETDSGDRGYEADLLGFVGPGRFDVVAKGLFWGEGTYTGRAPKGKFPLAVAFTLAAGAKEANKVAPQGTKGDLDGYLK
jgi:hypothetical protein